MLFTKAETQKRSEAGRSKDSKREKRKGGGEGRGGRVLFVSLLNV